jgi:hypothetical protein
LFEEVFASGYAKALALALSPFSRKLGLQPWSMSCLTLPDRFNVSVERQTTNRTTSQSVSIPISGIPQKIFLKVGMFFDAQKRARKNHVFSPNHHKLTTN